MIAKKNMDVALMNLENGLNDFRIKKKDYM